MGMSHQGFIESETSGNADVSADHKGTFAREAAKQEKQVSSGIDFSGDSGYGSITHSPSQGEEFYYQNSGCVTPSRSIEWEVTECPEDEFEYQQQERFIDSDFFFLYELMWKNEAFEPSSRVGYTKVHTADVSYNNDNVSRNTNRLSRQRNPLQTTITLSIEASPNHRCGRLILKAVTEPVQGAIRAKILRFHHQRMTHG